MSYTEEQLKKYEEVHEELCRDIASRLGMTREEYRKYENMGLVEFSRKFGFTDIIYNSLTERYEEVLRISDDY